MKIFRSSLFYMTLSMLFVYGCLVTAHSPIYQNLLDKQLQDVELGRMKFLYGDMGGIFPHTLKSNGFAYKMGVLALSTTTNNKPQNPDSFFMPYGFRLAKTIDKNRPPQYNKPTGMIFGELKGTHPIKGRFSVQVANLGCGSCHGAPLYGKDGQPTDDYVLGMPNTSLNLNALAHDLFSGYRNIIQWNEKEFDTALLKLFPNTEKEELNGLNIFFKTLKKEINKIVKTRSEPAPYNIGGTGTLNGIGAIKVGLGMIDRQQYHSEEISAISIPTLANRSFRSSLLVSGNYAPKGNDYFYEITNQDTTKQHDLALANIVSLFTIGTMGFDAQMAANAHQDVKDVMVFVSKIETSPFPAEINAQKAALGRIVFQNNCASCHGRYEGTATHNKLVSFPNRFVSYQEIGTDSVRAVAIKQEDLKILNKIPLKGQFKAQVSRGYVAPILSGLWATAPYFHNGSVPTLWHLLNPEQRPNRFYVGGHLLDYDKVGIKGEMHEGIYKYNKNDKNWANYEIYDTQKPDASNKGHEKEFDSLTQNEKQVLIEFLKTL